MTIANSLNKQRGLSEIGQSPASPRWEATQLPLHGFPPKQF